MKRLEDAYEEKKLESQAKEVELPCEAGVGLKKKRKPLINFMATSGNGPLFLKAVNCFGEVKDRFFIAELMKEVINEIGHQNVVQIINDNAANCKSAGEIIERQFPHIYWTPCVVHTLNLALKNICSPRNVETNQLTYEQCSWIKEVHEEALAIKNFIHGRTYDIVQANLVKEYILNDEWWDKVAYILSFIEPIYEMIRVCDTDKPCLHLVYEMWDAMIEKVKIEIYKKEKRLMSQMSYFYEVVHHIYSDAWLLEDSTRCASHRDGEISQERTKCFRRLFPNDDEYRKVLDEYAMFSMKTGPFDDLHAFQRWVLWNPIIDVKMWDVGGDAFDSMEDVGFLEVVDLSLDEPDFENHLI
ncbi:hypothetical protein OSB04_028640 [Centaurea solstitialis]|uniref:DUF659 domain-containing protein n=1 Tax=Centaurea solstitialis TaxID=347529 RepID=A0AA38W9G5_9ASTR|nr:hypothetical protein OSB04_028640 [Centaurea solstitialis]